MSDTVYGFNKKAKASELSRWAAHLMSNNSTPDNPTGWEVRIVELTEAVSPSGTTATDSVEGPYNAKCLHFGTANLVLTEQTPSVDLELYNFSSNSYGIGDVVMVARWRTLWVIIGGDSASVRTFVTSSAVTARSGATAGTGTAVSYTYDDATGNYVTGTESPPFDIINPYNSAVSTSVVIQCHAVGDKWEIIQSECEGA
jgi:hypothetical protein